MWLWFDLRVEEKSGELSCVIIGVAPLEFMDKVLRLVGVDLIHRSQIPLWPT